MKVYDFNENEMILNDGSIIMDANNPEDINYLLNVSAIQKFREAIGGLNGGEPYGTGNKVRIICPNLNGGLKVLSRDGEAIITCNEIIPIQKITYSGAFAQYAFAQYGVIYCDIFKTHKEEDKEVKGKKFLIYEIKDGEFTYKFYEKCKFRNNDLDLNSKRISITPVKTLKKD